MAYANVHVVMNAPINTRTALIMVFHPAIAFLFVRVCVTWYSPIGREENGAGTYPTDILGVPLEFWVLLATQGDHLPMACFFGNPTFTHKLGLLGRRCAKTGRHPCLSVC
jgi:hypothetical protein